MRRCFLFCLTVVWFSCTTNSAYDNVHEKALIPSYITDSVFLNSHNPSTPEKTELGRYLFYDTLLSVNRTKSCASCHSPEYSFTDGYRRSAGSFGDLTQHNSPPLINLIFNRHLTYSDSSLHFPEQQIRNPLFHTNPVELGWKGLEEDLLLQLRKNSFYQKKFRLAFPSSKEPISINNLQYALASFVKSIVTFQSPYDRFLATGGSAVLPASVRRGQRLFFSDALKCSSCHSGINFNRAINEQTPYFNTGFFSDTAIHRGLMQFTGKQHDAGKYRVPTLRNLAFTAPYLHDGSAETLEEVVRLYEKGGLPGVKGRHPFIGGFQLNSQQRTDLIRFLLSLSDSSFLKNPSFQNPNKAQ